ncbi:SWP2-like protein [Mya arenaria]|uniref:SWP2-like protein n=1 Tax=Mya arenaria TaxID=6604 RepID=A0ABY7EUB0_MYAAR|nr:SWP2-like protein [Mya arenaria]
MSNLAEGSLYDNLSNLAECNEYNNMSNLAEGIMYDNMSNLAEGSLYDNMSNLAECNEYNNMSNLAEGILYDNMSNLAEGSLYDNMSNLAECNVYDNMSNLAECNVYDNMSNLAKGNVYDNMSNLAEGSLYDNMSNLAEGSLYDSLSNLAEGSLYDNMSNLAECNVYDNMSKLAECDVYYNISNLAECKVFDMPKLAEGSLNLTHHIQFDIGLKLKDSWGKLTNFTDVLHNVFAYHKAEAISTLLRKEVGSQLQAKTEIKKAAEDAGLNNDQYSYVFATDAFALYSVTQISRIKASPFTRERDTKQFSSLCFDTVLAEKGSYDIFQDGEICNNSRDRIMVNGQSLRDNIEQFLCVIFSKKFIDLYKWKYTYHFHMLCKDFEEQAGQYDIATAEITLQFKHFVDIAREYHCWPKNRLIEATSSLVFSKQEVLQILDVFILNLAKCLRHHQAIVMRSKYENPMYIHEEGCEVATTIQVNPPPEGWSDEVEFQYTLTVTKNAQMVEVVDLKSGRKHQAILIYKLNIEFLRDLSSVEMQTAIFSGLKQDILKKRATYTFGVMTTPPFQKGKDPDNYKFVDNEGVVRNRGVFYKLIKKGTLMSSGQIFSAQVRFVPWVGSFSLYRCPSENPDIEDELTECNVYDNMSKLAEGSLFDNM